jgi:hypothetical protein
MLAARKLGLEGVGDLNCPGDPECPGYVVPGSVDYQTSLLQAILANQGAAVPPDPSPVSPATAFLSKYAVWIGVGGLALVLLPALTGGRR